MGKNYERKMEAIKKKMQAMKVEKDNACDRVDVCEEACKAAKIRASKAEDEVEELMAKARQLETELDLTTEKFGFVSLQLEEREKAEAADTQYDEVAKKLVQCESDLEKAEERAEVGETKIIELEEELRVVANNLKSLEVAEEKANQREKTYI